MDSQCIRRLFLFYADRHLAELAESDILRR